MHLEELDITNDEWSFLKDVLSGYQFRSVDAFHLTIQAAVNENRHLGYNIDPENVSRDFTEVQILTILNAVR